MINRTVLELEEDFKAGDKVDVFSDFFGGAIKIQRHLTEAERIRATRDLRIASLKEELTRLEEKKE